MTDMEQQQKEVRKKALKLLEHMDRTEKGLYDRLLRAGFSEALAADAVAYVKDYGYVMMRDMRRIILCTGFMTRVVRRYSRNCSRKELTVRRSRVHGTKQQNWRCRMKGNSFGRW